MEWMQANWVNILALIGAVDGLAYVITKITKTTADDNIYTIVHNFIFRFITPPKA